MPVDWSRAACDRPRTRAFDACRASRQLIAGARGRIDARLALGATALVEVGHHRLPALEAKRMLDDRRFPLL